MLFFSNQNQNKNQDNRGPQQNNRGPQNIKNTAKDMKRRPEALMIRLVIFISNYLSN
jgi:hypothetical protein